MLCATSRALFGSLVASLALGWMATLAQAADADASAAAPASSAVKVSVRLPNYYREIVTEEQREKIYEIQRQFNAKIQTLEAELEKLKGDRDTKVEAILTPDQKLKLEQIRAKAKATRDAKKTSKEQTPAATAAAGAPPAAAAASQ